MSSRTRVGAISVANTIATTSAILALVVTLALLSREVHKLGYTVISFGSGVPVAIQTNTTD